MKRPFFALALSSICVLILPARISAQPKEFQALESHFLRVITARFNSLFEGISTVERWEVRKQRTRAALERMLWHNRRWPATPPPVTVTGRIERPDYTVENLILETAPKLFSTANLYLPRTGRRPFPVVLYQCGHANKNRFTHHGAWFAARGIAVMIMDNIEMGEIQFTHHGVYSNAWFHWYSRGFSPLAVELLNARRSIDYLCTRSDIDRNRIGATGVSGGGMATFFLAAIDERVKASAPVSGSFSTLGWIKHRLSSAHCDCQYPVNSYGLMYEEIGALTAPRVQLLCNADADRGFPMDSFNEMVDKMGEIYRLLGAGGALRTAVVPGGHGDHEVIRLPVYSFFLKEFLGIDAPVTAEGPVDTPPVQELVCFRDGLPLDGTLSRADEEIVPAFAYRLPAQQPRFQELISRLRNEVFRYFPANAPALNPEWSERISRQGRIIRKVSFNSFEDLRVRAVYSLPESSKPGAKLPAVLVVDHRRGIPVWGNEQPFEVNRWGDRAVLIVETLDRGSRALEQNLRSFSDDDPLHHMKRQAMVMGTTLESMQVYEILQSLRFLRGQPEVDPERITVAGRNETGINGLYAALLDEKVARVVLASPSASHRQGPHYLGILRYTDIPEVVSLMGPKLRAYGEVPAALRLDKSRVCASLPECLQ